VQTKDSKITGLKYSLMIRDDSLFNLFFKAAAASPIVKDSVRNYQGASIGNANYFESARCILNRLLVGKINLNQTLIGLDSNSTQGKLNRQIYNDRKSCLGTTESDLETMSQLEVSVRKEKLLRASVMASLPQYLDHMSDRSNDLLANMDLGQYLGELYVYPELITQLNSDPSRASQQVNENELSVLLSEVQKNIEGEYQKFNELNALRSIWKDRRMQNLFNSVINNCNYSFTNEAGAPVDFDFLIQKLTQAEDFYFISSAFYDISNLTLRLTDMSEGELKNTLKNYLIQERINAVEMAITTILNRYKTSITPSINNTLIALEPTLTPLTQQIITDRLGGSTFDQLILLLVKKIKEQKQSVISGELMLNDFAEQMIVASNSVAAVLNEKSDPQNLKYDRAAHLAALSTWLSNLSEYNTERLKVIVKESDFSNQTKLWQSLNSSLESEAQSYGLACSSDGFFKSLALSLKNSLSKSKNPEYAAKAQSDCIEAQRFAKAAGFDRAQIYQNMSTLLDDLKKLASDDEFTQFISDYRQELAAKDLNEFRMLDMPIDNLALTKEYKKSISSQLLQKLNSSKKIYEVLAGETVIKNVTPLIKLSVVKSLEILKSHKLKIENAKNELDFDFFIHQTRLLNAVYGEAISESMPKGLTDLNAFSSNSISDLLAARGFYFPNLLAYHTQLQNKAKESQKIQSEGFDEFLQANIMVNIGVLGGWAIKHTLGILPKWVGGPSVASVLSKLGHNGSRYIDGQGWLAMALIGAQLTTLQRDINLSKSELKNIQDLTQVETLKPDEGENPLALIEWSNYRDQYNYYVKNIAQMRSNQLQDIGWLAFPIMMNRALQFGFKKMVNSFDVKQNFKFENMTYQERIKFDRRTQLKINHKIKLLNLFLKDLNYPKSITYSELVSQREIAMSTAKTASQRARINESYNKIIKTFGGDIDIISNKPQLLYSYARALNGEAGTLEQLSLLHNEYLRILKLERGAY
jgi:hypothetical protein